MKTLILSNEKEILSSINESLAKSDQSNMYIVDGIFTVAHGKGVRKNLLQFSVVHKGISTVMLNFDINTLKPVNGKPLGKYSKEETNDMINIAYWVYYRFILPVMEQLTTVPEETTETIEVSEVVETAEVNENKQINNITEESYIVGNRNFKTYENAYNYCIESDFDPELMITNEAANIEPLESITIEQETTEQTEVYYLYNNEFTTYSEAYNYCITNDYPVTMILSNLHPYMTTERLQELELQYKFSKQNMSIIDMKEYFDYIGIQQISTDQEDRYYKLRSWIERYENKQKSIEQRKQHERYMAEQINTMLSELYSIGMTKKEYEHTNTTWYYLNNELIYNWSSGISTEKMYNELTEVYKMYYIQEKAV
jgi:hypothetical protein